MNPGIVSTFPRPLNFKKTKGSIGIVGVKLPARFFFSWLGSSLVGSSASQLKTKANRRPRAKQTANTCAMIESVSFSPPPCALPLPYRRAKLYHSFVTQHAKRYAHHNPLRALQCSQYDVYTHVYRVKSTRHRTSDNLRCSLTADIFRSSPCPRPPYIHFAPSTVHVSFFSMSFLLSLKVYLA